MISDSCGLLLSRTDASRDSPTTNAPYRALEQGCLKHLFLQRFPDKPNVLIALLDGFAVDLYPAFLSLAEAARRSGGSTSCVVAVVQARCSAKYGSRPPPTLLS
jgi:hypothetical protein